ncbi:MAG: J domain-containing protein [Euryarchaeota archaeon]|nr:J domain-containing protein [Euryarchaeota archaeon]MDE1835514.1 J domain-containing protein [Euryarchaeota archaeon]MDE1879605.1 J domain-containing protein [Euryarchaeota archaeon]MDE2043864.1 J domain-containing protein [Thermoplasmata archaeon]
MEDDYAVLGLRPSASPGEVRAAYRRLARRYHPDAHHAEGPKAAASNRARFEEVTEAYLRIKEGHPRRAPAPSSSEPRTRRAPSPPPRTSPIPSPPAPETRVFRRLPLDPTIPFDWAGWGGKEGAHASLGDAFARGSPFVALKVEREENAGDVNSFLDLTVRESLLGAVKRVVLLDEQQCRACGGSGKGGESRQLPCAACGGTGRREESRLGGAWKSIDRCTHCGGTGKVTREECDVCGGKGRESRHDMVMVEIPPGSPPGRRLRLQGLGRWDAARNQRGDYYLTLALAEGPEAWHEAGAQHMAFPVPQTILSRGGQVVVPGRNGPLLVPVAAGTTDGETVRLPHAGPRLPPDGASGALVLHLRAVEDPGDLPGMSVTIPAFLRKAVPTQPGERMVAAWSAYLDSPKNPGFLIVTSQKLVFLSKENLEGVGMEWFAPVSRLALQPIEVPPNVPRDRTALWAVTIAGRRVFLRRTLAQIEKIHAMLEELRRESSYGPSGA